MSYRKPLSLLKSFWLLSILLALVALQRPLVAAEAEADAGVAAPKNVAELQAIESQVQKVVAKVLPCTVGVRVGPAGGSGVIVSETRKYLRKQPNS